MKDRQIRFFDVTRSGVRHRASVSLRQEESIGECAWKGSTEIVCLVAHDSGTAALAIIRDDGRVRRTSIPPQRAWHVPAPADLDGPWYSKDTLIVRADAEVWLGRCVWGYLGDADPCVTWSYVRLLPSFARSLSPPARVTHRVRAWSATAPRGYRLSIQPSGHSGGDRSTSVICQGPGGARSDYPPAGEQASSEQAFWIAPDPPLYLALVEYAGSGEDGGHEVHPPPETGALFRACESVPLAESVAFALGPEPFWAHGPLSDLDKDQHWTIFASGRKIGTLDREAREWPIRSYDWVAFAPDDRGERRATSAPRR